MDPSRRNLLLVILATAAVAAAVVLFLIVDRAPSEPEHDNSRMPPRVYRPPPRRGPIPARRVDGGWHPNPDRVGLPPAQPPSAPPPQ